MLVQQLTTAAELFAHLGGSDDSDSDSGSETGANRFLKDASSDSESDDEDVNKVLKSAKDKRFDELEATIRLIENAQKISDWAVISERMFTSEIALEGGMSHGGGVHEHC